MSNLAVEHTCATVFESLWVSKECSAGELQENLAT